MTVTTKPRPERMSLASDESLEQAIGKILLHLAEQVRDWGRGCSIDDPQLDSILDRQGSAAEFLRALGAMAAIDPNKVIGIAGQIRQIESEQIADEIFGPRIASSKDIAAREVTLPSEAHVHFRADPPQALDHSGWPKHIRDNIRSPANPDDARMHASKLKQALLECGWRHGSCHSDFDEEGDKWGSLIDLAKQIVMGLDDLSNTKEQ